MADEEITRLPRKSCSAVGDPRRRFAVLAGFHGGRDLSAEAMRSNPRTAAQMITEVLADEPGSTGLYYDEKGRPMQGSPLVHDPEGIRTPDPVMR